MSDSEWCDLGSAEDLSRLPLQEVTAARRKLALTVHDSAFGAIAGTCNHAGGPLGQGRLEGEYVVGPWHYWKFHCRTGEGEPGYEGDRVPRYAVKVEGGRVLVDLASATSRARLPHPPHPLARTPERAPGPVPVVGISTTAMTRAHPRFSGSDHLLTFFAEIGCHFPAYPFVGHSRGWSAEDMENNVRSVRESTLLREGAEALADRALALAATLLTRAPAAHPRGGRKACRLEEPGAEA